MFADVTDLERRGRERRDRDLLEHGRELLAPARGSSSTARVKDGLAGGDRRRSSRTGPSATRSTRRRGSARSSTAGTWSGSCGYIDIGRARGRPGRRPAASGSSRRRGGYFVPPTIFDNVRNDMTIAREEIFGPVLSVIEFETEAEAVALANDTPYGLAASLYTERPERRPPGRARAPGGRRRRQRLLRGRHDDAVRRLQAVGLRRPRQEPSTPTTSTPRRRPIWIQLKPAGRA